MFMAMLACDRDEIIITRTRLTLIDILATAGGFASILLLVSRNFSCYYGTLLFKEKLINHLCKISSDIISTPFSSSPTAKSAPTQRLSTSKQQQLQTTQGIAAFIRGLSRPRLKALNTVCASCCSWIKCRKPS